MQTPTQLSDGILEARTKGVMQGGVLSPFLSNLFLHYVFDLWMKRKHTEIPWCRYADDGLLHCRTEEESKRLLSELNERFKSCGLAIHPEKTKIVYCKDDRRKLTYSNTKFDFLGYTFRHRTTKHSKRNILFESFNPAVSNSRPEIDASKDPKRKL